MIQRSEIARACGSAINSAVAAIDRDSSTRQAAEKRLMFHEVARAPGIYEAHSRDLFYGVFLDKGRTRNHSGGSDSFFDVAAWTGKSVMRESVQLASGNPFGGFRLSNHPGGARFRCLRRCSVCRASRNRG